MKFDVIILILRPFFPKLPYISKSTEDATEFEDELISNPKRSHPGFRKYWVVCLFVCLKLFTQLKVILCPTSNMFNHPNKEGCISFHVHHIHSSKGTGFIAEGGSRGMGIRTRASGWTPEKALLDTEGKI